MTRHPVILLCSFLLLSQFQLNYSIAQERRSLSTSRFVEVSYKGPDGNMIQPCGAKKATYCQSYVSIGVTKLTVNKHGSWIGTIFNTNRCAFGEAKLTANYNSQTLSICKVGKPIVLRGSVSSVDLGVEWAMLDRVPWVLKNSSIEIRVGHTEDSTITALIDAFSSITSSIPEYKLSSSLAIGFAITSAVDKLLFEGDRTIDLLNAQRDLPLLAGRLCEGYYAIFAAENNSTYEKYYRGNVAWTGNDLEFNGNPIDDVTYAVVAVDVSDRYYPSAKDSINDTTKLWSKKYREVLTSLFDLVWVSTIDEINEKETDIKINLIRALTLLDADVDLIQEEKQEIHEYVLQEARNKLEMLRKRIDNQNNVTTASTEEAIMSAINTNTNFVDSTSVNIASDILLNPKKNIPKFDKNLSINYNKALNSIGKVISK